MKRARLNTYGRAAHGVFINGELRESVAYKVLTPAARLVLIDWLGKYMQLSRGDTSRIENMSFTFSDLKENISYRTFATARAEILRRGFFREDPDQQTGIPGSRRLYAPSTKWRAYQPCPEEQKRLDAAARDRNAAVKRWARFRTDQALKKRGRQHE